MPFFRRKSEKGKPPTQLAVGQGVKRTPSNASSLSSSSSLPHTPEDADLNGDIAVPPGSRRPCTLLLEPSEAEATGDLGMGQGPSTPLRRYSKLSKSMEDILQDKNALQYFIGFMESKDAGSIIRFWLDANSFQASTVARQTSYHLQQTRSTRTSSTSSAGGLSLDRASSVHGGGEDVQHGGDGPDRNIAAAENSGPVRDTLHSDATRPEQRSPVGSSHSRQNLSPHEESSQKGSIFSEGDSRLQEKPVLLSGSSGSGVSPASPFPPASPQTHSPACDSNSSDFGSFQGAESQQASRDSSVSPEVRDPGQSAMLEDVGSQNIGQNESAGVLEKKQDESAGSQSRSKRGVSREDLARKLNESIERDAVNIFTKYLSQDATHPIGIPDELRNDAIKRICPVEGKVDPHCFEGCQNFAFQQMQERYHQPYLDSEFYCKHQVDLLTSGSVDLADVLYNEVALGYFMEYLEQEGGSPLLQFWIAADNFQQHLATRQEGYDGMEAQSDAMVLYDKYFSLQATDPLGFDDKIRFEVEGNICREGGPLPDCFAKPRDIVLKTIKKLYFPGYLKSDMYYKYLSDLISMVQSANIPQPKHRRQGSDASSEHSAGSQGLGLDNISAKNTLLAAGVHHKKATHPHRIGDDLKLDSVMLNPDELWKRPNAGKMSFGKVNSLGQFESEVIPQPEEKKKEFSLTGGSLFFKRKADKEKEQEEMALQVAQLILQDVQTMTQTGAAYAGLQGASSLASDPSDPNNDNEIPPHPPEQ